MERQKRKNLLTTTLKYVIIKKVIGLIKNINIIYDDKEYIDMIKDILDNNTVQKMREYKQHYDVSCFFHCLLVSYNSYLICKKHNLDYKSVARAGMLHDLFLYDWHIKKKEIGRKGLHAFTHAKKAYENAVKLFKLNDKEKDIIKKHMWPVTFKLPRYKESFVVTYVDKCLAISEKNIIIPEKYLVEGEVSRLPVAVHRFPTETNGAGIQIRDTSMKRIFELFG